MSLDDETTSGPKGRKRGGTLRIDRARIIDVAKGFDPQNMTMQAVADELGVDRKALNYHVTDRDGLVRLVAADLFESHFAKAFSSSLTTLDAATPRDWRNAVRAWATAVRDSAVATGVISHYHRLENGESPAVFEPVELVLNRLMDSGFDARTASRAVVYLTRLGMGVGRDILLERQLGEHPQGPEVRRLLDDGAQDSSQFPALRALIAAGINGPDDVQAQFDFEVDTFVAGMEQVLLNSSQARSR